MSNCVLIVNGKKIGVFKTISISKSVEAISSTFKMDFNDVFDSTNQSWPLNAQDAFEIQLHGKSVVTGFIDILEGELSADSIGYSVEGRDKTADLVDCSAIPKTYSSIALLSLCKDLSKPFGIDFKLAPGINGSQRLTGISAEAGETVFDVLDKISSKVGVLFTSSGDGNVLVTKRGDRKADVILVEGVNAKNFKFKRDYSNRFSEYTVQGSNDKADSTAQPGRWFPKPGTTDSTKSVPKAIVKDLGVRRHRPFYDKQKGKADSGTVKQWAQWEANIRAAKSLQITCTVKGWLQSPGRLWKENELVQVSAPRLGIGNAYGDEYIIAEIEYALSEGGGETTNMTLYPKDAYLPEPFVKKKKKDEKSVKWFSEKTTDPISPKVKK